jgi:hypothetical protein
MGARKQILAINFLERDDEPAWTRSPARPARLE